MRYIIYGAGGIGSVVGGMLAHSGQQALLISRPDHAAAINADGLLIKSPDLDLRVKIEAAADLAAIRPTGQDCIMLAVKTQHTPGALAQIREHYRANLTTKESLPAIVCLQNGVRNEAMAAATFSDVIAAMVNFNANYLAAGIIERTLWNKIGIGDYPEGIGQLAGQVADDLTAAGFDIVRHHYIMRSKWGKLIANLNNATHAIVDMYLQKALADAEFRAFMADVMAEGIGVLDQAGIELDDGGLFDARAMLTHLRTPLQPEQFQELPADKRSYPSTWQDLVLGRKQTEVRFFNGEIIGIGAAHGLPTPYNSVLLEVIERMTMAGEKPGRYSIADLRQLVATHQQEIAS